MSITKRPLCPCPDCGHVNECCLQQPVMRKLPDAKGYAPPDVFANTRYKYYRVGESRLDAYHYAAKELLEGCPECQDLC